LEEDDKCIFYPVALFDKNRVEYQSITMYQRMDSDFRKINITDYNSTQEEDPVFWPVETSYSVADGLRSFTMYKHVDKKIHPVSTTFSPDYKVKRCIPKDPMVLLPELSANPPPFSPTERLSNERLRILEINSEGFLGKDEERLFVRVMELNQKALAFEDSEQGTFKDEYFSPYKIATVPHIPWEYKNIPIPPGILQKVIDVLKLKMEAGMY
jgi:hypothetical protein